MTVVILYSPGGKRAAIVAHDPECEEARAAAARLQRRGVAVVPLPRDHSAWLKVAPGLVVQEAVKILHARGRAA